MNLNMKNFMFSAKSSSSILLCLFALFFATPNGYADGTKQVMPNATNGTAIYIRAQTGTGPYLGAVESSRLYFSIGDASVENLYFGVQARVRNSFSGGNNQLLNNFYYRIYNAAGVAQTPATLFTNNGTANGYIPNYASAIAGPNIGGATPTGYNPITFNPTANGDYYISLYASNDGGASATTNNASGGIAFLPYFDFTVSDPANNQVEGRIWSRKWDFITYLVEDADGNGGTPNVPNPTGAASFEGDFFAYTDDDIIVKVEFENGFRPYGFSLSMNRYGVVDDDDDPSNVWTTTRSSISHDGAALPTLLNGFPVFITEPDQSQFPPGIEAAPLLSGGVYGCPGAYLIPVVLTEDGDLVITLDLDGAPGFQTGTEDLVIELFDQVAGNIVIPWDGLDGLGNPIAGNVSTTLQLVSLKGRTSIPMNDAELNINGLNVTSVAPVLDNKAMYWDDSNLGATTNNITTGFVVRDVYGTGILGFSHKYNGSNPPGDNTPANPAPGGGQGSDTPTVITDDYGNVRTINTWFYGSVAESPEFALSLPSCDNDNDGIVDNADDDDDNDGILDTVELSGFDPDGDADSDGVPDYIDPDFAGFVDVNSNGVDDRFDIDGDGVIDSFDLDSDADGCFDALEGDGGIIISQLDGNGAIDISVNGVDGNGVPNDASGGQADVSSDDNLITGAECKADLSLTKTINNATPKIGETIIYTLILTNSGPSETTGVQVKDLLPSGLVYDLANSTIPAGTTYNDTTGIWDFGTVTINSSATYTLQIAAKVTPACGEITNNAEIINSDKLDSDSTATDGNVVE